MTPLERKSFANLLLLCKAHHEKVDGEDTWRDYSVKVLLEWKDAREKPLADQIVGLQRLTEDDLERKLAESTARFRREVMDSLEGLTGISEDVRNTLKDLMDEPFTRKLVDPDALASLEYSAKALAFIQDYAPILHESARALVFVQEYAPILHNSAQAFSFIADHGTTLRGFSNAVGDLPDLSPIRQFVEMRFEITRLAEAAEQIRQLDMGSVRDAAKSVSGAVASIESAKRDIEECLPIAAYFPVEVKVKARFFGVGAAVGATLIALIQILALLFWK